MGGARRKRGTALHQACKRCGQITLLNRSAMLACHHLLQHGGEHRAITAVKRAGRIVGVARERVKTIAECRRPFRR